MPIIHLSLSKNDHAKKDPDFVQIQLEPIWDACTAVSTLRYENMKICQKHERSVEERRTDVTIEKCPAQAFCDTGLVGVVAKY